ncbi:MAG: hypothetical protein IPK82_02910 [Polyangiaceae bacterium]|nr:hypothetical protein [Polyangiaceae bacterium]
MQRRHFFVLAAALGITPLMAGCGPKWIVLTQAAPNPLLNQNKFAMMPTDYTGLIVGEKSEADYLASKDEESRASWAGDKGGIDTEFNKRLTEGAAEAGITIVKATGPGDAPFMIRPKVEFIEGGIFTYVYNKPSEVRMKVQITTPDGKVIDEIAIKHGTPAGITNPAIGNRLRDDGEALGKITAQYLKMRVTGAQ